MTDWLNRLIVASNGRPFTPAESERVADYAESLPARLAAVRKLEDHQKWLAGYLADAVADKAAEWGLPPGPLARDFSLALAAVGQAALMDDPGVLYETVARPFGRLADALDIPPDDLSNLFDVAAAALSRRLGPDAAALLGPYFAAAAAGLRGADIPDPELVHAGV